MPGHVWAILSERDDSFDVAKSLGLTSGGTQEASGMVVPAKRFWGFADLELLRFLESVDRDRVVKPKGISSWWNRVRSLG